MECLSNQQGKRDRPEAEEIWCNGELESVAPELKVLRSISPRFGIPKDLLQFEQFAY
jgi:hypothetical protein